MDTPTTTIAALTLVGIGLLVWGALKLRRAVRFPEDETGNDDVHLIALGSALHGRDEGRTSHSSNLTRFGERDHVQ